MELICSDERTHRRMDAGNEATSSAPSTSPTPWQPPQRSGIARLPSGDSPPKTTFPTTIIAGALTSSAIGVAALGTIFFSAFTSHPPTHALAITAWACLVPVAAAFVLIFRLPMQARAQVA
jgi:hypothetical protein